MPNYKIHLDETHGPGALYVEDDDGGGEYDAFALANLLNGNGSVAFPWMGDIRVAKSHGELTWHVERLCESCDDIHICRRGGSSCEDIHYCQMYRVGCKGIRTRARIACAESPERNSNGKS